MDGDEEVARTGALSAQDGALHFDAIQDAPAGRDRAIFRASESPGRGGRRLLTARATRK